MKKRSKSKVPPRVLSMAPLAVSAPKSLQQAPEPSRRSLLEDIEKGKKLKSILPEDAPIRSGGEFIIITFTAFLRLNHDCQIGITQNHLYRIRPIKRTVLNKRTPLIFRRFWGTSKCQRSSPHVKYPPRSNPNQITYLSSCLVWKAALSSECDRHSLGGAIIRMFDKIPATEKFPSLIGRIR